MPTTDFSAGLTTARHRQIAFASWQSLNPAGSVRRAQAPSYGNKGTGSSAFVPLEVAVGQQLIGQTSGGGCGCTTGTNLFVGNVKKAPVICNNHNA